MALECDHKTKNVVTRRLSNGPVVFGTQCQDCGVWQAVKFTSLTPHEREEADSYDEEITKRYWKRRGQFEQAVSAAKKVDETINWRDAYKEYLSGEVWAIKRRKALERDKWLCQACLQDQATQVHHRQYPPLEYLGSEPIYWLVSLCESCHESIHLLRDLQKGL